jgi:hypothetical protein
MDLHTLQITIAHAKSQSVMSLLVTAQLPSLGITRLWLLATVHLQLANCTHQLPTQDFQLLAVSGHLWLPLAITG